MTKIPEWSTLKELLPLQLGFKCFSKLGMRILVLQLIKRFNGLVFVSDDGVFRCSNKARYTSYLANAQYVLVCVLP